MYQVEQRIDHDKDMKVDIYELKHWMAHVYHHDLENEIMQAFFDCNKKKVRAVGRKYVRILQVRILF